MQLNSKRKSLVFFKKAVKINCLRNILTKKWRCFQILKVSCFFMQLPLRHLFLQIFFNTSLLVINQILKKMCVTFIYLPIKSFLSYIIDQFCSTLLSQPSLTKTFLEKNSLYCSTLKHSPSCNRAFLQSSCQHKNTVNKTLHKSSNVLKYKEKNKQKKHWNLNTSNWNHCNYDGLNIYNMQLQQAENKRINYSTILGSH